MMLLILLGKMYHKSVLKTQEWLLLFFEYSLSSKTKSALGNLKNCLIYLIG